MQLFRYLGGFVVGIPVFVFKGYYQVRGAAGFSTAGACLMLRCCRHLPCLPAARLLLACCLPAACLLLDFCRASAAACSGLMLNQPGPA